MRDASKEGGLAKDFGCHGHDERIRAREGALDGCRQTDGARHVIAEHINEFVCGGRCESVMVLKAASLTSNGPIAVMPASLSCKSLELTSAKQRAWISL
jgi:hypothetical protein